MTAAAKTPFVQYLGDGATAGFAAKFRFNAAAHVLVRQIAADGSYADLVYGVDYSVSGGTTDAGGTVTLTVPPPVGSRVQIRRVTPRAQEMNYAVSDTFPAESHEAALDKAMLIDQEQDASIADLGDRSLKVPIGEVAGELPAALVRAGRYAAWDGGGGMIAAHGTGADLGLREDLADPLIGPGLGGFTHAADYTPGTMGHHMRRSIVITDAPYNADPSGVVDATAAFAAAIAAAAGAPFAIKAVGKFKFAGSVTGAIGDVTIVGDGETEFIGAANITMFRTTGSRLKFRDIAFTSATSATNEMTGAVAADSIDDVAFFNCRFNRVLVSMQAKTAAARKRLRVLGCVVEGDYANVLAPDNVNVFDLRGVQNIVFSNNIVEAVNYFRLIKASTGIVGGDPYQPAYSCGRVAIVGNVMHTGGTGLQQVIDLSFNTKSVVISGNQITTTGASVPYVIHAKSANGVPGGATPDHIVIAGNSISCGAGTAAAIYMEANWGVPGFAGNTRLSIANNSITAVDGIAALIAVKGFNFVSIHGNVTDQGATNFGRAIAVSNCQATAIRGNVIGWGSIEFSGGASTQDGALYANSPQSLLIAGNIIDDFRSQGAINIFNCAAIEDLTIADNHIRNQADNGVISGAIYADTVTVARAHVHDNIANLANSAKNYFTRVTVAITDKRERSNSWNMVAADWDPASVAAGAAVSLAGVALTGAELGDWVQVSANISLQGLSATGYLSAAQTGVVLLNNNTGAPVDLGNATWRVAYGRG